MPFFEPDAIAPGLRAPTGVAPPNPILPSVGETFTAAAFDNNPVVNLFSRLHDEQYPVEDGHNPLDLIKGTIYEQQHMDRFVASRSARETNAIMGRIDFENANQKVLEASGALGTVAQIATGSLDPTLALPAGTIYRTAKGGYSVARSAASVGAAAGAQATIAEGVLQATQETRTAAESAIAIGSATILGALLGSAASILSPAERKTLENLLDRDRQAMDAHAGNSVPQPAKLPSIEERLAPLDKEMFNLPGDAPAELKTALEVAVSLSSVAEGTDKGLQAGASIKWALENGRTDIAEAIVARAESQARSSAESRPGVASDNPKYASILENLNAIAERQKAFADELRAMLPEDSVYRVATSAGAAATDTRALNLEKTGLEFTAPLSPTRRVLSAESIEGRRTMADLAETPYRFEGGEVPTQGPALSRIAKMEIDGARVEVSDALDRLYADYRFGDAETRAPRLRAQFERFTGQSTDLMTFADFKKEIAKALQEGDQHSIPQVARAAQKIRERVFDPWKERAIDAGLLPEDVGVKTAESYFSRVYNKELINARRPEFVDKVTGWLRTDQATKKGIQDRLRGLDAELQKATKAAAKGKPDAEARVENLRERIEAEIAAWEGKSVKDAKTAMKAREKYAKENARPEGAGRLKAADDAIDKAVSKILASDREIGDAELRSRSQEITDRILGSPDGRLPYDAHMGGPGIGAGPQRDLRGALNPREFAIPDAMIREFLEQDVEQVVAMHLRTMVPDVLLTERFGDVRMTEPLKRITEEYAAKIDAATSEKKRVALAKERDAVIRDVAATRDRIRGVFGWSPDLRNMARVAQSAKIINNLTSMGMAAVTSLSDSAGVVFRHGFQTSFADGWAPMAKYMAGQLPEFDKFKTQMRAVGIGIDTAINARQHALDDTMDVYKPQSRFERTLQNVGDKFFIANLLSPLTDIQKTIAAHVTVSEILRAAKKYDAGTASQRQIDALAENGIDRQMASRIAQQFDKGGAVENGVHLPNTADWTDKAAAQALNGAVAREVDIAVVTPGQEKPLWMSQPVIGLLGQFKSFTASATERILIANLQRRDANTLSGLVAAITLGMLSYKINSMLGGQPTSDRPQDWFKEGISRGGVLGWFEEGNALASKMTRGGADVYRLIGADKPLSRFASRSTLDMFLGPTAGKITGLSQVTGAAASMDWAESDTKALRRLFAFQNLWFLRGALNQVEEGVNGKLGIEPR